MRRRRCARRDIRHRIRAANVREIKHHDHIPLDPADCAEHDIDACGCVFHEGEGGGGGVDDGGEGGEGGGEEGSVEATDEVVGAEFAERAEVVAVGGYGGGGGAEGAVV